LERRSARIHTDQIARSTWLLVAIRESVAKFTGSQTVTDDRTCLSVKIGSIEEYVPSARVRIETGAGDGIHHALDGRVAAIEIAWVIFPVSGQLSRLGRR
jgi:hypothetical protein